MEELRNDDVMMMNEQVSEAEVIDSEELEVKKSVFQKGKDFGAKLVEKAKDGIEYVKEHPGETLEKASGVAMAAGTVALVALGISKANKIDRTVYSEDIQECVELKKKLNNKDKTELDYRMKTGQTKIEALNDMNLIK